MISFDATVYKVQTLLDGGIRVTFDLPEYAISAATELMKMKRDEMALRVGVVEHEGGKEED